MSRSFRWRRAFLFLFLTLAMALCPLILAQEGNGQLDGTVRDMSGAYIPGATITAVNTATGQTRSATSDSYGNYVFPDLPIGNYTITARASGFAVVAHTGVVVSVGLTTTLNSRLVLASVHQEVTVSGGAELLNTVSAEGGRAMAPTAIETLPLNGRNFLNLVTLTNGVEYDTSTGRQSFVINGSPPGQGVNFLVDGTDASGIETTEMGGGWLSPLTSTYALGLDSIAEFTVHTGDYSAKYGRAMGGVVEIVTKSGTNQLHGDAFEFLRNNALNANLTQNNAIGLRVPKLEFNQFGASTGGPIKRDKMFFWLGYEGVRRIQGLSTTYTVLSSLGRASVVDPNIAKFISTYLPEANTPPTSSNRYLALLVRNDEPTIREDMGMGRWDWDIGEKDHLFARYDIHDTHSVQPGLGTISPDSARQQLITLSDTHIFSPTTTGNLRVGVNRIVNLTATDGPPAAVNLQGIFDVAGGFLNNYATSVTEAGDFAHVMGRHTLGAGFEIRQVQNNRSQGLPAGSFNFFAGPSQMSNFFNNLPDQLTEGFVILGNGGSSGNIDGYFEDTFKATHNLTASLGLRYDYFLRPMERHGRMIGIVGSPFPLSQIKFTKPGQEVVNKDLNGFGPRVGLAYSVRPSLVIRAGGGIYVGQDYNAVTTAAAATFVPPIIPQSLFDPYYVHPLEFFTRKQFPGMHWPDDSTVASPAALLENVPPPTPDIPLPDWGNTYSYQWSLTLEAKVAKESVLSVGYVGSTTHGIVSENSYNAPGLAGVRPNPAFGPITLRGSFCDSNYNGLQASFSRPIRRGMEMSFHYTWAHSIDDIAGFSGINDPGVTPQTDSLSLQRGDSTFDYRHYFTGDIYYNLPFNVFQSGPGRLLMSGWTVGGIITTYSGPHYTVVTGRNIGDGVHTQRPNGLCANSNTGNPTGLDAQMLNPSCFAVPTIPDPATGFFVGTLGRNTLTAPSLFDIDSFLQKDTKLSEKLTAQFRAEFFNFLNNTNWNQPISSLNNPNFGKILGEGNARQIQFALKLIW